ncbi:MAG: hypothetical protein IJG13_07585 [Kiritimatiellae bacterium]|nr:hypothetical protein [Kiritimatiellia bacterium]
MLLRSFMLVAALAAAFAADAEVQVVNGQKYECSDGVCRLVDDGPGGAAAQPYAEDAAVAEPSHAVSPPRIAQGYMSADRFVAFLENREPEHSPFDGAGTLLMLLLVLLGGLALNLTPCVLPMIPVNLLVIGKSAVRGLLYGLGIAMAYGALGVAAAVGGLAFGTIQSSPWFNAAVAAVFVALALSLLGVFRIDFSARRFKAGAFLMGVLSAILAGACVAPILVSVLLLTADGFARGNALALGYPFVLGVGMALPWPFLGAGMQVLPKPGAWMRWVNRAFAVVVVGFAAWYGHLALRGFGVIGGGGAAEPVSARAVAATPSTFAAALASAKRPVLVDCWASWCKNCAAMDRVMEEPAVRDATGRYSIIRLQAEDIRELQRLEGFERVKGLPAFAVFE